MIRGYPDTLTIIPTYQCTAACENCCFGSHPGIRKRLPLDRILSYIEQAADLGSIKLIVFTGGECFLIGDDLTRAIAHCSHYGIATRCVSNAYWATNSVTALERLRPLVAAGLGDLNVSTGDAHQAFVPIDRVINAVLAASDLRIRSLVVVESKEERAFTAATLRSDTRWEQLQANAQVHFSPVSFESPWMSMDPWSSVPQPGAKLTCRANLDRRAGCDSILRTIVVTPSEQLGACCGLTREQIPELHMGLLTQEPMRKLVDRMFDDLLRLWISLDGPDHILAWAASYDPGIDWEGRFAHHCESCRFLYTDKRVRATIETHWDSVADDILLRFAALDPD